MARFKVGVLFKPQHCGMDQLREGWRAADDLGVDTVWTWDHFYPLYGDPDGANLRVLDDAGRVGRRHPSRHGSALS